MAANEGRVCMVTGATQGIGLAVARELVAAGWRLSLGVRDPRRVPHELLTDPEVVCVDHYDATDEDSIDQWRAATLRRFGRIDALVHCAGISSDIDFEAVDAGELERVWRVNTLAPTLLVQAVLPQLRSAGSGRIVLFASLSGKRVRNPHVAYIESKFAVVGLAHTVRQIAWDDGVRVCCVCPSFVDTPMTAHVTKVGAAEMTPPASLAHLTRTVMELPDTASVAELLVNCRLEDMV